MSPTVSIWNMASRRQTRFSSSFLLPLWPCFTSLSLLLSRSLVVYLWPVPFLLKEGVVTQCRVDFCTFATCSTFLPAIWEADFFFLYPASFFRMTVHTNICTTYSSCRHNRCALIPSVFLRMLLQHSKMPMRKELSFSVREALNVYSLLVSFSDYLLSSSSPV